MQKIASFTVDHEQLDPGLYLSRVDSVGDHKLYSYDLRFVRPNKDLVLNTGEMHTLEHLGATYLRNDPKFKDEIIYFGPMGCRTGFYLITTDQIEPTDLLDLLTRTFEWAKDYDGEIPGNAPKECGNYLDHNLAMARYYADIYYNVLKEWTDLTFSYQ